VVHDLRNRRYLYLASHSVSISQVDSNMEVKAVTHFSHQELLATYRDL